MPEKGLFDKIEHENIFLLLIIKILLISSLTFFIPKFMYILRLLYLIILIIFLLNVNNLLNFFSF